MGHSSKTLRHAALKIKVNIISISVTVHSVSTMIEMRFTVELETVSFVRFN